MLAAHRPSSTWEPFSPTVGAFTLTNGTLQNGTLTATSYALQNGSVSAVLVGSAAVTKSTAGTVVLSASNTYTGGTTVAAGTLQLGVSNALPYGATTGNLSLAGSALDLGGLSANVNGLSGTGTVANSVASPATLTVGNNNATSTFAGALQDAMGTVALTKTGSGLLTLTGVSSYSGATSVSAGTLNVAGTLGNTAVSRGRRGYAGRRRWHDRRIGHRRQRRKPPTRGRSTSSTAHGHPTLSDGGTALTLGTGAGTAALDFDIGSGHPPTRSHSRAAT